MLGDDALRRHLLELLRSSGAHMTFEEAVKDFPSSRINERFPNASYGAWQLLEHMRIAQRYSLSLITDDQCEELRWPDDYWPSPQVEASSEHWEQTMTGFLADLRALCRLVEDPATDLGRLLPHGNGYTVGREIIVAGDHNSYHIGELAIMRQAMGAWPATR